MVFPSERNPKGVMSENTINKSLRLMGYNTQEEATAHGFRTLACSALYESGLWQQDAIERQMSHREKMMSRRLTVAMQPITKNGQP